MEINAEMTGAKRILVVDDERAVRETIKVLLFIDHYTVVEACNGAEALNLFIHGNYDLVLTDFEMPLVKGDELALKIKRLAPAQQILMMTGYGRPPGPDNPVDAVLNKPFNFTSLRAVVADLLAKAEVGRRLAREPQIDAEPICTSHN